MQGIFGKDIVSVSELLDQLPFFDKVSHDQVKMLNKGYNEERKERLGFMDNEEEGYYADAYY